MKTTRGETADGEAFTPMSRETLSRRELLAGSAAVGATLLLPGGLSFAGDGKKTFTILHTNDLHSNFIGMAPFLDYSPDQLNDDKTRGGFGRLATLIAEEEGCAPRSGSCVGA